MKKKYLIIIISLILSCLVTIGIIGCFVFHKISLLSTTEIEKLISNQIGYNVAIANVKPKWVGVNLVMRIEYITLQDKATTLPIFQADYIESKLNLWKTISHTDLRFSRIIIGKPQIDINLITKDIFANNMAVLSSLASLREIKEINIINGELKLYGADNINSQIAQIDLQIVRANDNKYKLHGLGFVTSRLQTTLVNNANNIVKAKVEINYTTSDNFMHVKVEDLEYYNANIFAHTIHVPLVNSKIAWQKQDHKILFDLENVDITLPEVKIKADISAGYQNGKFSGVTFHGITDAIKVDDAHKYVPTWVLPKELSEWLRSSIKGGTILSNSLVFSNDKFDWMMNFKDVNLEYAPLWPALHGLSGNLHLNEKQVTIVGVSGKILNIPIGLTTASVDGLNCQESFPLIVEGEVNTTLLQGIQFLLASPLRNTGKVLDNYKPQGNMKLGLNLKIPLVDTQKATIQVNGALKVSDGALVEPQFGTTLANINGDINFSENKILADKLVLKILGQQATAKVDYDQNKSKALEVVLAAQLKDKYLVNLFPILSSAHVEGATQFNVKVRVPMAIGEKAQIMVNSDLSGLGINLPYPLGKTVAEKTSFGLTLRRDDLLKMHISYGDQINGELILENSLLKRGQLMFGNMTKINIADTNVLSINGRLKTCVLREWLQFGALNSTAINIPMQLDLLIDKLTMLDTQYDSVWLRYDTTSRAVVLAGDKIAGTMTLAIDDLPINANFKKIAITNLQHVKTKSNTLTPDNLPMVIFKCEDFSLNANSAGRVNFRLRPKPYGYDILALEIDNEKFNLQGQGKWNMLEQSTTQLSGNITSKDFGKVFSYWGLGGSIRNGSGNMSFIFDWNGSPMDFNFANITGNVNLDITSGQILGVNPGFGRIIGLLSLDNIQRRLKLDFSDLLGSGFSFDKLQANFNINKGSLHTEGVFIDGPSAYIALSGDADMKTKQINFKMGVVPKVGASLPLAAAITAGHPALGAAFWILNKATGSKSKSTVPRYRYKVSGTWEKPEINEIKEPGLGK